MHVINLAAVSGCNRGAHSWGNIVHTAYKEVGNDADPTSYHIFPTLQAKQVVARAKAFAWASSSESSSILRIDSSIYCRHSRLASSPRQCTSRQSHSAPKSSCTS